jgi:hypothetical protein
MEKSIPDMLRDAGTNEWHMACTNPAIADLFTQRSKILAQKAAEVQAIMLDIDKKYAQQLQEWEQEYRVMISLSMPGHFS